MFLTPHELNFKLLMKTQKKGKFKGMLESSLVYCCSGIQSLFEVILLYTFYTFGAETRELKTGIVPL